VETALIAALVAGTVSLIGLLAQLQLGRMSRLTSREQPLRELERAELLAMAEGLRRLHRETELLRIQVWRVLGRIDLEVHAQLANEIGALEAAITEFDTQGERFLAAWADAKTAFPSGIVLSIRELRHQCRHKLHAVVLTLREYSHRLQKQRNAGHAEAQRLADLSFALTAALRDLLHELDEFSSVTQAANLLGNIASFPMLTPATPSLTGLPRNPDSSQRKG